MFQLLRGAAFALVAAPLVLALAVSNGDEVVETWPDGTPKRVFSRDAEGRYDGPYLEYWKNGELKIRTRYSAGELDGRHETWWENGKRHLDVRYADGLLDGRYQEYDEEGERRVTGAYDDGRKDGDFEIRRDGKVASVQEWSDGLLTRLDELERPVTRTRAELAAELHTIANLAIEPDLESEFEGAIDPQLAEGRVAALKRLMEYRALSGLAYADMTLDAKFNWHCAMAAKLLEKLGRLDHTPKNPGLPEAEYRAAYEGTSHSNLSAGSDLVGSIDGYMDDSDPSNVDRVGHRRWCLNPPMKKTGFGIVDRWSAMWSFDESRGKTDWTVVAYPAPGYYPASHIVDHAAWSVRLRDLPFQEGRIEGLVVEVYALDEDYVRGAPMRLDHRSVFGGQVIFRAQDMVCAPGRAYEVRIGKEGKRSPEILLHYLVEFVDLTDELAVLKETKPE
jgi:hypothetical protein